MGAEPIFGEMLDRIRRAAKHGTRLHLETEHVLALLADDIYAVLSAREAQEIRSRCRPDQPAPADPPSVAGSVPPLMAVDSNSGLFGSGIAPIGTTGISVGSTAVSRAAHRRVSEVAAGLRRKKPKSA